MQPIVIVYFHGFSMVWELRELENECEMKSLWSYGGGLSR